MAVIIATSPLVGGECPRMPTTYIRPSPLTGTRRSYHARVAPLAKQIRANAVAGRIVVWSTEPCAIHLGTHMPVFRIIPATVEAYREFAKWAFNVHLVLNPQREDFERAEDCTRVQLSMAGVIAAPRPAWKRIYALNPWI